MALAITPEGTRSRTTQWHTGFLHMAYEAKVPLLLAAIDGASKTVFLTERFIPTGDVETDMRAIKSITNNLPEFIPKNFQPTDA